jgi:molecular chaperone GrpE
MFNHIWASYSIKYKDGNCPKSLNWGRRAQYIDLQPRDFCPMSDPKPQADKVPLQQDGAAQEPARALDEQLAAALAQLEEQRDARMRALAEADNVRKRALGEIAQARKYAAERVIEDLLPVMDSLEAALGTGSVDADALRAGVELTRKQLQSAFERAGAVELAPAPGQRFDPHRHQAMAAVEADQEPNTVVALLQKGYALHDRVVRPALVSVAKAKTVENGPGNPISDSNLESN